jgi:pantetheine-phosphate adenylyltransferase
MRVLFPGSFDPVTNGHLHLITRLVGLMETVIVGVAENPSKQPWFSMEERVTMLREVCAAWPNVEVISYRGLTVEAARSLGAEAIVRGVRNAVDCASEVEMAHITRMLGNIETLFLPAAPEWTFVSSRMVREIATYGGDIAGLVPATVLTRFSREAHVSHT